MDLIVMTFNINTFQVNAYTLDVRPRLDQNVFMLL